MTEDPSSNPMPDRRREQIARILGAILVLNLAVAAAKLGYGYVSGALSITADGFHSLLDASSDAMAMVTFGLALRPPDWNHPYGHRKYETFGVLGIAAMMFFGCIEILTAALDRWRHPRLVHVTAAGVLVILATLAVNLLVYSIERRQGRKLQSEILTSDAAHTGSDVLASLLVLLSFGVTRLGVSWADLAAAVLIVVLIVRAGFQVLQGTLSTLSDERRIEPELIESVARGEPGVLEAHNVRSRGTNDDIHVDLHVLVEPTLAIADAHRIGHRVEDRIRAHWPGVTDVVVHVEPGLEAERGHPAEGGGLKASG